MNAIVRCLNLFLSFGECGRTRVRHRSSLDSFVSYRSYGYTIVKGGGDVSVKGLFVCLFVRYGACI